MIIEKDLCDLTRVKINMDCLQNKIDNIEKARIKMEEEAEKNKENISPNKNDEKIENNKLDIKDNIGKDYNKKETIAIDEKIDLTPEQKENNDLNKNLFSPEREINKKEEIFLNNEKDTIPKETKEKKLLSPKNENENIFKNNKKTKKENEEYLLKEKAKMSKKSNSK